MGLSSPACLGRACAAVDLAHQLPAFLDHQLAVADLAADAARGVDDQFVAHGQIAVEATADFGQIDLGGAAERALFGDLHQARIHGGLDRALDQQGVAIGDLNALQFDVRAHGELAAALAGRGGGLAAGTAAGGATSVATVFAAAWLCAMGWPWPGTVRPGRMSGSRLPKKLGCSAMFAPEKKAMLRSAANTSDPGYAT
jgi:hypothetical protein